MHDVRAIYRMAYPVPICSEAGTGLFTRLNLSVFRANICWHLSALPRGSGLFG